MLNRVRANLRRSVARRLGVPEIEPALGRLARQGFSPERILDVGAYHGEFALICREMWPGARIACVEPQGSAVRTLEGLCEADSLMSVHPILLGAENRESVVLHEAETASSVLRERTDQGHPGVTHPMGTVDTLVEDAFAGREPDLLKLDVQGYELEVLKGAEKSLSGISVILAEVNLLDIHEGVPLLADIVAWLSERGFVAFDVCGLTRRPIDAALWQIDMIFVPQSSPLRSDKRWSA